MLGDLGGGAEILELGDLVDDVGDVDSLLPPVAEVDDVGATGLVEREVHDHTWMIVAPRPSASPLAADRFESHAEQLGIMYPTLSRLASEEDRQDTQGSY